MVRDAADRLSVYRGEVISLEKTDDGPGAGEPFSIMFHDLPSAPLDGTSNYDDPFREGVVAVREGVLVDHAVRRIRLANSLDPLAVSRTGADSTAVDLNLRAPLSDVLNARRPT